MTGYTYHEVLGNTDQTEGKGRMRMVRAYESEEAAVEWVRSTEGVRSCAVMGVGTGDVDRIEIVDGGTNDGQLAIKRTKIWGYRQNWQGKWGYGYIDNRDAPVNDPDYKEFLRLKAKFGGL